MIDLHLAEPKLSKPLDSRPCSRPPNLGRDDDDDGDVHDGEDDPDGDGDDGLRDAKDYHQDDTYTRRQ